MAVRKARAGSGAAQHAWEQGGAAQHASKQGGAAQHAFETKCGDASELTVAFYNMGIQMPEIGAKRWEAKERRLAADIVKAIKVHELDILCLSELGQVGVGLGKKFPEGGVVGWLKNLLADKNVSPVDIYADGHYATIVLSGRVDVLQYQVIKDFHEQADRSFQHFRLRTSQRGQVISLINCHAPSAKPNRILTVPGRVQYFKAFHKASAGDPFMWGGDFNTKPVQFATLLEGIHDRYIMDEQPGSLQVVFSHPIRLLHGDLAATFGLCSAQVNSGIGASYNGMSDAHDVVVAKVFEPEPEPEVSSPSSAAQHAWQEPAFSAPPPLPQHSSALRYAERPTCPMPTRATPRTEAEASSASSAAQPARQEPAGTAVPPSPQQSSAPREAERPERQMPGMAHAHTSVAQPAQQEPASSAPPPRHHRVNAIFGTDSPSMAPLQDMLEEIRCMFLWGKVAKIVTSSTGCYELATVSCIVDKLEAFLAIVDQQRSRHLHNNPRLTSDAVFSEVDMQTIFSAWEKDHDSWANEATIRNYNDHLHGTGQGDRQKAHQLRRRAFSAFLFQIIGNKHLVLASIQHPIFSAAQPAEAMQSFFRAWEKEKASDGYKKRLEMSKQSTKERKVLKSNAHAARQALVQGKRLHAAIHRNYKQLAELSHHEKVLLDDLNSGKLARVRDECDAAFGWNREMRDATGSTASNMAP